MRQTSLLDAVWVPVKDGNDTAREIFEQHYSRRRYADERIRLLIVGPGEKLLLLAPDANAVFAWRKFKSDDGQQGINCAIFRNEGPNRSSDLIRAADLIAWEHWPGERHYTYVDPKKVRRKRDPGRCFLRAGWRHAGWTKGGHGRNVKRILEIFPPSIAHEPTRADHAFELGAAI